MRFNKHYKSKKNKKTKQNCVHEDNTKKLLWCQVSNKENSTIILISNLLKTEF